MGEISAFARAAYEREHGRATDGPEPPAGSWAVLVYELLAALRVLYWRVDGGATRAGADDQFAEIIRGVRSVAPMSDPAPVAGSPRVQESIGLR